MKNKGIVLFMGMAIYLATPCSALEIIFQDEFVDNSNGWSEGDNKYVTYKIDDGKFIIDFKINRDAIYITIPIVLNEENDFLIESTMEKRSGKKGLFAVSCG